MSLERVVMTAEPESIPVDLDVLLDAWGDLCGSFEEHAAAGRISPEEALQLTAATHAWQRSIPRDDPEAMRAAALRLEQLLAELRTNSDVDVSVFLGDRPSDG
ncbi:hypothetical protein ACRAWC_01470 [Leifsonia sp. L25]|uniref:hypothetical protein n=1 Tax=Actinomycetes TaxID=1760 RepID=UPI003D6981D3